MPESREVHLTMDLCLRVGETLMANGAGAADVTATMQSLAIHLGLRAAEIDVTFTSLSMSFQSAPDAPPFVLIRQVKQRDIDYEDLTRADHLVRDVLADRLTLAEARVEAARIASTGHQTPRWAVTVATGVMCAGVGLMLGGDALVIAVAALAGIVIDRLQLVMARRRLPTFYLQIVGGGVATLLAVGAAALSDEVDPSLAVTANIIMLLSGIGFMGALQDALSGFYLTASARIIEALLATAGLIAGVSGGLTVAEIAGVEIGHVVPGRVVALDTLTVAAVGAGIAAAAFAVASYSPWRVVVPIALVAAVAMLTSEGVDYAGFDRTWAAGVAALAGRAGGVRRGRVGPGAPAGRGGLGDRAAPARPVDLPRPVTADRRRCRSLQPRRPGHGHRRLRGAGPGGRGDPRRVPRAADQARGAAAGEPAGRAAPGRPVPGQD